MLAKSKWAVTLMLAVAGIASLPAAHATAAQVAGQAVVGRPFGVASVSVPLSGVAPIDPELFSLSEANGRALYPVFQAGGAARRVLGQLLGAGVENLPPREVTVSFLFVGDEPLNLTVHTPAPVAFTLRPQLPNRRADDRLLGQWWRQYHAASQQRASEGDYPPLVETYLSSMLAGRLGLETPLLQRRGGNDTQHEALKTLELLAGAESLHMQVIRETMLGQSDLGQLADQPVPDDVLWQQPAIEVNEQVAIEPIAALVPPECFYIRFGKFSNYLWMNRLTRDYGGDLANMIAGRGLDRQMTAGIERQLAVKYNELSELVGDQVVNDLALIGRDTFFNSGAAFGLLFEAKNAFLFQTSVQQERAAVLAREKENGATEQSIEIAGRKVSLLSTPDNRIRSFFAAHENYRLITSSRAIVERFYAVIDGEQSLAQTPEYVYTRAYMPLEREDTIFIYLPSAFFRGLVSPQYQIELTRRMKAEADIELLRMARLTARNEGSPAQSIDELVAGGFLPREFGRRPDGSGPIEAGDSILDSRRGARGSFLPIPDVELTAVTRDEAFNYAQRAQFYRENWQQMDPLVVGIRRYSLEQDGADKGLERLVIDANVAPFAEQKYGWIMSLLGPPTNERITTAPGDIISFQASVRGGLLSPNVPPHHLFLGIQDSVPATDLKPGGLLKTLRMLQTTPGYLGAWPKPGFLDWLPPGLAGEPDIYGFSQLPLGLWRRQFEGFSVLSFNRDVLAHVTDYLDPVPAENAAQIRLHVGDLSTSQLSAWVNAMLFERASQASAGNVQLLHTLTTQLGVPAAEAKETAERLLGAKLICPLGGEYELVALEGGADIWHSTAWLPGPNGESPVADYQATLLEWFRGLDAGLTKEADRLFVHAELDMQRKPSEPKPALPLFNFNLFGGGAKPSGESKSEAKPAGSESPKPRATNSKGPREF